ncbi:condensation domain-containing protein [Phytohabitans houttuyneae]|uniref:Condensation domain-containing protein n=1 Tax=Phytohabitans houttuyneae TaxID=1076126 RepID=A0A6V8KJ05_9ACTN|nr:condensation domain-containing protein [Phytohabitans houttuyneae]GFJ83824.1 hypothetical protein Phou_080040 [Phytohabitans houttuyneae]
MLPLRSDDVLATTRIVVPFEGDGEGVEDLSWGQLELWQGMRRRNTWMPVGYALPAEPGTTVADVVAELRFAMGRYQPMRTRLRFDPDGRTRQVVSRRGEVTLEVVDVRDDGDPAEVAEQVRRRYWDSDYDFVEQWPVRAAVVRHRGLLTHRVMVLCHLVTDGFGALVMLRELSERDPHTGPGTPVAMQPVQQARWQRSPAGRRQCDAALRYWEQALHSMPAGRFTGGGAAAQQPRHWSARLTSRAMYGALLVLAARLNSDTSPLLLGVFATAWGRVTGKDPVVARVVVNNRFRPGLGESVSQVAQTGLLVAELAGLSVDAALDRVRRRAIVAYKHAYYDPERLEALVRRVGRERGEELDIGCFYSDRRLIERDPSVDAPVPDEREVRAALPETTFRWESKGDEASERLFVFINPADGVTDINIFGDTAYVSPAQMEACLRGMEAVALEAAFQPTAAALTA